MNDDPLRLVGKDLAGKYRVERALGEGGFGVVYAGVHLQLGTRVAIKCLKGAAAPSASAFLREARVLFDLTHPGIVRMYDLGEHAGVPYVVLELVAGDPLDAEIDRRRRGQAPPWSAAEIGAIAGGVLDALAYAHARSVVHGDLKPSNVMVLRGEGAMAGAVSAKVLDFGTALVGGSSVTGGAGLTPRYAAPEQWDAALGRVGPATDVFAVGLVLEELVTCQPLVRGETVQELLASVMAPRTSAIRRARPDLAALADVVERATRTRPGERFASAGEMAAAMRAVLGGAPHVSLPPPTPVVSSAPVTSQSPLAYTATPALAASTPTASPSAPPLAPLATAPGPLAPTLVPAPTAALAPRGGASYAWLGCLIVPLLLALVVGGGAAAAVMLLRSGPASSSAPLATTAAPTPPTIAATAAHEPGLAATASAGTTTTATATATTATATTATATAAATTTTATTATTAKPTATPGRHLAWSAGFSADDGLYPDAAKFIAVVDRNVASLEECFRREHPSDAWMATVQVTFTRDGGRNPLVRLTHEGAPEDSPTATRIRECIDVPVAMWPWPTPTGVGVDGGRPYVRFVAGYTWRAN